MLAVAHVLGLMMAFFASTFLMPLACSVILRDGMFIDFAASAAINVVVGLAIAGATRSYRRELKPRDGFLLVTLSWVLMSASAAVPLLIALPGLSFTDAYFETMSGLTTTGSTVLTGLDDLPPSINLWRHALHWFGGIGIIVLAVAILPLLGVGGMQLYRAETPGPVKDEKLTPRITETAKALWLSYSVITAIGIVALKLCGMSWFDAVCHTFSVMALGGFSTHDSSVAWFDSPAIEAVLIVLMIAASLSFARHFMALRRLTLQPYLQDSEAKAVVVLLGLSVAFVTVLLVAAGTYPSAATALRHSAFNVVSIATTTGFVSQNYETWPAFAPVWMLFLSGVVCATGSTGGGVKMFRTLLLMRQASREMKLLVHPSAVIPVRIGGQVVPDRVAQSVLAFIFLYFQTITILTFALLLTGVEFLPALSTIVASVNNMGPGIGATGPAGNYQGLTDLQTWICTVAMLLGRLEIFSVLVLFTPAFWRK
ncbi:MAG: potassium transporter [Steroidobacteraceae bacterium]|jgi:trk system potassium uptake protein TrkH|nr:potassium transporter [Steroidobacteraceae bacterium]